MPITDPRVRLHRLVSCCSALLVVVGFVTQPNPAAATTSRATSKAADPSITVVQNIDAKTHIKKLNQDVTIPRGTFTATIDLVNGHLTGHIVLPPSTVTMSVAGVGLVTAKFKVVEAKSVQGVVDLTNFKVRATARFNILIPSAYAGIIPVNLVGNSCRTSRPVSVTMAGTASLTGPTTFTSNYTIPPLANCSLATIALNQIIPGPDNTFSATTSPKK